MAVEKPTPNSKDAEIAALKEELEALKAAAVIPATPVDGSVHGVESKVKERVTLPDGSIRLDY